MKTATTKTCAKCGEEKELTEYHVRPTAKDGFRNECKVCVRARNNANYRKDPEARRAKRMEYYRANRDEIAERRKKAYHANPEPHRKRRKEYRLRNLEVCRERDRQYRLNNIEKRKEKDRQYRLANLEKVLKYQESYRNQPENRAKRLEHGREYYKENRESFLENARLYRQSNPEKVRARENAKARRRKAVESDNHTLPELHAYWRANGIDPKRCTYCDAWHTKWSNNWKTSAGDHVVPLVKGGKDVVDNIMPCCFSCNCSKGDRTLGEEWVPPKDR